MSRTSAQISRSSLRWWTVRGRSFLWLWPDCSAWTGPNFIALPNILPVLDASRSEAAGIDRPPVRPRALAATPRGWPPAAAPMVAPALPGPPCPSKDSDARQEEAPPQSRAILVIAFVLLLVAGIGYGSYWSVSTVRASFPQTTGIAQAQGPVRAGRRQARRQRHPADLRRHLRGPLPRPGLRPGAGPLLRDGRPPPPHRRAGCPRCSARARSRPTRSCARWAGAASRSRSTTPSSSPTTKQYLQAYTDGVNAYLRTTAARGSPSSTRPWALGNDYKPETWTPVDSVAWLKAMAWDLRGNMQEEIDRALLTSRLSADADRAALPGLPVRAAPADRRRRRARPGRPEVRPSRAGAPRDRRRRRARALEGPALRRCPRPLDADARPARPERQRHRLQLLGRLGQAHDHRQAAARQRPAPGAADAVALVPDGPALPHRRAAPARSTSPATPSPACPASSSATTRTSPGA